MAKKSKVFRICFEGQTASDGRKVSAKELRECVETFNPETYTAPVNVEHTRPIVPGGPLDMKGRVLALSIKENDTIKIGTGEKAIDRKGVGLYAEVEAYDGLIQLNAIKQKRHPSAEIAPNFGGTNKFGLIGVALTDSPAVLGVHLMEFSTKHPDVLNARKQHSDNFFTATVDSIDLELIHQADVSTEQAGAFAAITKFFSAIIPPKADTKTEDTTPANPAENGGEGNLALASIAQGMVALTALLESSVKSLSDANKANADALETLKTTLEAEPDTRRFKQRAKVDGTECSGKFVY